MSKRKALATVPAATKPPPNQVDRAGIGESIERVRNRRRPVSVVMKEEGGNLTVDCPHDDPVGHRIRLFDALGSRSDAFISTQLGVLEHACRPRETERSIEGGAKHLNAALAIVDAVRPENELEAALAVQMAQSHALSTEIMGLARHTDSISHMQTYVLLAAKLQRGFAAQIDTLARMRGKGQQTVRVEHVTVEQGAQAIIGDVHHHPRGPGMQTKIEGQSHAHTADNATAALPGPNPLGAPVPATGREKQEAVPDARRDKPRRRPRQQ